MFTVRSQDFPAQSFLVCLDDGKGNGVATSMDLHERFPGLDYMRATARRRIPHFAWEYLDSATGRETTARRNRAALDRVLFNTSVLHGDIATDLSCRFLGRDYAAPFGIAPVGMSGLMWPRAEFHLARHSASAHIPYTLSTVATRMPEELAGDIGQMGWFQLYPPRDAEIRRDMLDRAKSAGFHTLVLTLDASVASRRERQTRGGLRQPPKLTPRILAQVALCPVWALGTAKTGMPRMRMLDKYADQSQRLSSTGHVGYKLRACPDWDYVQALREEWDGPLILKGVMTSEGLDRMKSIGVDAIWVSNHAGRQFDASPAAIDVLPETRKATDLPIIFDSGVETGLDILRALALGADFVMMGRAWHYALGALGGRGPAHLHDVLAKEMHSCLGQIGVHRLAELSGRLLS